LSSLSEENEMAKNVQSIIDDLESGLTQLRLHFESLSSVFGGERAAPGGRKAMARRVRRARRARRVPTGIPPSARKAVPAKPARKKMTMSPALRKQRQLQGRYMGLVRRLPKAKQAQVKKVRETKGYEAALKMMG
jgi:hypothetical protein